MKRRILAVWVILVVLAVCSIDVFAADISNGDSKGDTEVYTIELTTRSILIIDRSGSMEDRELVEDMVNTITTQYEVVAYFDDGQLSVDSEFRGGGNSSICEQIDQVAKAGFTHIGIVTDGQQWPTKYEALGVYTDLDLTIYLVGDLKEDSDELINEVKSRLINSNLKVITPDGKESIVLEEYQPPIYEIEIPVIIIEEDTSNEQDTSDDGPEDEPLDETVVDTVMNSGSVKEDSDADGCLWWLAVIIGIIMGILFDAIHEYITRIKRVVNTAVANDYIPVADVSGSMLRKQRKTVAACKNAGYTGKFICFGETAYETDYSEFEQIKPDGATAGWEAIELADSLRHSKIFLLSDLDFNQKSFQEVDLKNKFEKIMVVVPKRYNHETLEQLKKIAEEVEVISL